MAAPQRRHHGRHSKPPYRFPDCRRVRRLVHRLPGEHRGKKTCAPMKPWWKS
jgi:hypothetical protein